MSEKFSQSEKPSMMEVLKKYGSLTQVPDDVLEVIGYERVSPTRVVRKGEKIVDALERKKEQAPFKQIELMLTRTSKGRATFDGMERRMLKKKLLVSEKTGHHLSDLVPYDLDHRLINKIDDLGVVAICSKHPGMLQAYDRFFHSTPDRDAVIEFAPEVEIIKDFVTINPDADRLLCEQYHLLAALPDAKSGAEPGDFMDEIIREINMKADEFDQRPKETDFNELLQEEIDTTSDFCESLAEDLIKYRAEYGDPDAYRTIDEEELATEYAGMSLFELQKLTIVEGLRGLGYDAMADSLLAIKKREELLAFDADLDVEAVIALQTEIKTAPLERKKELSHKLKELKEQKKHRAQVWLGIKSFFDPSKKKAEVVHRAFTKGIDFLIHGTNNKESSTLTIIGTPDPVRDRDPGVVSGDCTKGEPLPFVRGDNSLYNLKIMSEGEHRGNIYLLSDVFELNGQEKKIWYLDAIQLPMIVDWQEGFPLLMQKIMAEAGKKQIDYLGYAEDEHLISNYVSISRAAKAYAENNGGKFGSISMPQAEKTRIQGGDLVYLFEIKKPLLATNPFE